MVAKRVLVFFIILTFLFAATSCAGKKTDDAATKPLSIYLMDYDLYFENAVTAFNTQHEKNLIESKTYFTDQMLDYGDRLKAELASGGGPDIIVLPWYLIPDFSKYIKSGWLYDLDEMIRSDDGFKAEDYYESVLDAGLIDGKRYFLPVNYQANVLYTTGDILDRYQMNRDDPFLSMADLALLANNFRSINREDVKYLLDEFSIFSWGGGGLTDILYKPTSLDSKKIAGLLEEYEAIIDVAGPLTQQDADYYQRLKDKEVALLSYPVFSLNSMDRPYTGFESGFDPELCTLSLGGEDEVIVSPVSIVAINANCRDKDTAYEFVKLVLSEEMQSSEFLNGLPVNRAAYQAQKDRLLNNSQSASTGKNSTKKLVGELDHLMGGTMVCSIVDLEALDLLENEASAFFRGEKTSMEAVASMQEKLDEYRDKPVYISQSAQAGIQESDEDLPSLTVWYMDYDWAVKNAVRSFTDKRKDVIIESKVCSSASYEEGVLKMTAEIMAGEGPDIICFSAGMFNSLQKTMETGVFCDFNELIANDESFKRLDLNQTIMDMGIYKGKRYIIPLRYNMPFMVSTRSVLENSGVVISDDWTLEDMKNITLDFASRSGYQYLFSSQFTFDYLLDHCGKNFIDYENSRCDFQSDVFISLMELYKDISPHIMPYDDSQTYELPAVSMQNKRYVMDVVTGYSPEYVNTNNSIYREILGEDMVLIPFPTIDGGEGKPVTILEAVAITETCENKQAALDFVEELLSLDIQACRDQYGNYNLSLGLPVNSEAFREDLNYLMTMDTTGAMIATTGGYTITALTLPEELASRMDVLVDKAVGTTLRDNAVKEIIMEGVKSYMEGKRTAQQAARDIDDKVRLFLSE